MQHHLLHLNINTYHQHNKKVSPCVRSHLNTFDIISIVHVVELNAKNFLTQIVGLTAECIALPETALNGEVQWRSQGLRVAHPEGRNEEENEKSLRKNKKK